MVLLNLCGRTFSKNQFLLNVYHYYCYLIIQLVILPTCVFLVIIILSL